MVFKRSLAILPLFVLTQFLVDISIPLAADLRPQLHENVTIQILASGNTKGKLRMGGE